MISLVFYSYLFLFIFATDFNTFECSIDVYQWLYYWGISIYVESEESLYN